MTEGNRVKHKWAPWAYYNIFTMGRFVSASSFYDAEGYQCVDCQKIVKVWERKQWEKDGKLETRQTGEATPETGCAGDRRIQVVVIDA